MPVVVVFGFILLIVLASLGYAAWAEHLKYKHRESSSGRLSDASNSIGLSELSNVIRTAVSEATAPLEERLDTIEGEIRELRSSDAPTVRRALEEPPSEPLLDLDEDIEQGEEAPAKTGRRVR
jgi:hypothetical protein